MQIFPPKYQDWLRALVDDVDAYGGMVHVRVQDSLDLVAALDVPVGVRRRTDLLQDADNLWGRVVHEGRPLRVAGLKDPTIVEGLAEGYLLPVLSPHRQVRAVVTLSFRPATDLDETTIERLIATCAGLPPI